MTRKQLFFGGRIYTMNPRQPVCDALVVMGDRIEWLGSAEQLGAIPSDAYEMIDLDGGVMVPGFIDSHTHLVFWAQSLHQIDLDGAISYEDALNRIRKHLKAYPPKKSEWVVGKGWKREQWQEPRWPHRDDLDRIVPDRPAALFSKDEHLLWVNSHALALAGIDDATPDPAGGEIVRGAGGSATGVLKDRAYAPVWDKYESPSAGRLKSYLVPAFEKMFQLGCVGVSSFDYDPDTFALLQSLDTEHKLPVRVTWYLPVTYLDDAVRLRLHSGFGSSFLRIGGVKIFADGALGSQTALMFAPFKGSRSNVGLEVTPPKELRALIKRATNSRLVCAIHAIGDRANRQVLDAFAAVGRKVSSRFKHRIEHCQIVSPSDIKRFSQLDITASMQPSHATADVDIMARYLGGRIADSYRFRTLLDCGTRVCFGSDAPIEELHPLHGIYAAVTGKRLSGGKSYNRKETLTVEQAVRCFTYEGARAVGEGDRRGMLKEGYQADLAVLDNDIFRSAPEKILETHVVATFIAGELKYRENGFLDL